MRVFLKVLKWVGIVAGVLVALVVIGIGTLVLLGSSRLNKTYDIDVAAIPIPTDEASIERGRHVVATVTLCEGCHGDGFKGDIVIEEVPFLGMIVASNLTTGKGGKGGEYTDLDFVRAIRHGVGRDGKPLAIMPSDFYTKLGDADVGEIIAYVRSLPPVDNEVPGTTFGLLGKIYLQLEDTFLPAQIIDHDATYPPPPEPGVTAEYGKYLALVCTVCHGENMAGVDLPAAAGEAPSGPNLTPKGPLATYTEQDFVMTIRTGVRPNGESIDDEFMP